MLTMGWIVIPGVFMSTRKKLMPLCLDASGSVRASTMHQSERWALLVQILSPLIT